MSKLLHIHYRDMKDDVLEAAQKVILDTFENHKEERIIANKIRQEFDKVYGESWNCIVGKNYGSHVIHQTEGYLFCTFNDEISVLLWKSS